MSVVICIHRPIPRVCVRLLSDEILDKPKKRPTRLGKIFLCGMRGTGKKTLAHRFGNMDKGPFVAEIPSRYFYTAHFNLDHRATVLGTGEVKLEIYLVPPPHDLPVQEPDFYNEDRSYNVMLFICSVIDINSLDLVLRVIRLLVANAIPYFLVVGNKTDLDRTAYELPFTEYFASGLIRHFDAYYYECSALQNIAVDPIVDVILQSIVDCVPDDL